MGMKTVTFTARYAHKPKLARADAWMHKVVVYPAGLTIEVDDAIADDAVAKGKAQYVATEAPIVEAGDEPDAH